jgi:adenosylcobinamide-GDP ribazoletransferase
VIAGKDQGADPLQRRRLAALPGGQPDRQRLEPAERARRLGEARLARMRGRCGSGIGQFELREAPPQVIKAGDGLDALSPDGRAPMLGDALRDGKVALAFLTRLRVRQDWPWQNADLAASVAMFPVVGLLVGLLGALAYAAAMTLGLPPLPAAVLAIAVLVWATGAMHEDGLADFADGLAGATSAQRLEIMRDPRVGSFGVIALVLALLARTGALAALAGPAEVAAALVAAAAWSRALLPPALLALPRARIDGLAAQAGRPHPARAAAAAAIAILVALVLLPPLVAAIAAMVAALAGVMLAMLAFRRLGGITGDVLGAIQQIGEITFLLTLVALGPAR